MSRTKDYQEFEYSFAAASAETETLYKVVSDHAGTSVLADSASAFMAEGFAWTWFGSEGNTDNTIDCTIPYATDGSNFTTVHSNGNTVGLADTNAALIVNTMTGDAAIAGGAAVAVVRLSGSTSAALPNVRVPGDSILRVALVKGGTSTIPAVRFVVYGHWV